MRRLVLLYDGTWNTLLKPDEVTNVVRVGQAVKTVAADGVPQVVYYNSGVGSGGRIDSIMGGLFGSGIKSNVKRGLTFLSFNYDAGGDGQPPDEIYIFGFSRGAYTARALAGVIGSIKGIPKVSNFGEAEELWSHYKKTKNERAGNEEDITKLVYTLPAGQKVIKCVAVWDTVGSYGIPTGLGLTGLAREYNLVDTELPRQRDWQTHRLRISRNGDRRTPPLVFDHRMGAKHHLAEKPRPGTCGGTSVVCRCSCQRWRWLQADRPFRSVSGVDDVPDPGPDRFGFR